MTPGRMDRKRFCSGDPDRSGQVVLTGRPAMRHRRYRSHAADLKGGGLRLLLLPLLSLLPRLFLNSLRSLIHSRFRCRQRAAQGPVAFNVAGQFGAQPNFNTRRSEVVYLQ